MSNIKRRHFLQLAGSTLATLGLSQFDIQRQGIRFARSVAQGTSRKLALIVGVNEYDSFEISSLRGCVTDAYLMQELLVHQFGFQPQDVRLVTDDSDVKPTRAGILQAFQEHLIDQAKPGDVVVFHFSGHGSQVSDQPDCDSRQGKNAIAECVNSTLCPSDSFALGATSEGGVVNDITGHSLFLLMSRVNTDNMTVVLDSCHSGGGTRGNYLVRSIPRLGGSDRFRPSPAEQELQQRLLSELNLSPEEFIRLRRLGVAKGTVIASARRNQFAYDVPYGDFHAGAFSYTMSRYLWQQGRPESFDDALNGIALKVRSQASSYGAQDLVVEYAPNTQNQQQSFFFLKEGTPAAEAVVLEGAQAGSIPFWLGGVSSQALDSYSSDTIFMAIDASGNTIGRVRQTSRDGLTGFGEVIEGKVADLTPGTLLREEILGVPTNLTLKVGLDESLGADLEAVRSNLPKLNRVEETPLNQSESVDYIIGKLDAEGRRTLQKTQINPLPALGSIGLFSPSLVPVTDSFGPAGQSGASAMGRLRQKFQSLLAARILLLTGGGSNSDLKIQAVIQDKARGIGSAIATRGAQEAGLVKSLGQPKPLKPETQVEIEITNHESRDLYIGALVIDSDGNLSILYPVDWEAPESASLVPAGRSLTIPRPTDVPFIAYGPAGTFELLMLASTKPLRNTLRGLQRITRARGVSRGEFLGLEADEPVEVMEALLGDFNEQTRAGLKAQQADRAQVDGSQIAVFSTLMQVTD